MLSRMYDKPVNDLQGVADLLLRPFARDSRHCHSLPPLSEPGRSANWLAGRLHSRPSHIPRREDRGEGRL